MVGQAFGLYTHQRNNRIRSGFLLAGLFLLIYVTVWGLMLVAYGYGGAPRGRSAFSEATRLFWTWWPLVTAGTAAWIFIGFRINVGLIASAAGAASVTREENPKL